MDQTYHIGDLVILSRDRTAGAGRVVAADTLFGQTYLEVYFPATGQVVRRPAEDFEPWGDLFDRLAAGQVAPAPAFLARLIARQLQALMTRQGVLSAANFRITPLPHQVLAVDFILGQFKPRCLIADEVGLGKTIEAAMVYEELKLRGLAHRVLVIVPSGLTHQWQQEFRQKFGEEFVIFDRAMLDALRQLHGQEANLWQKHDRIITSMDFIKPRSIRPDLSPNERARREQHNREVSEAVAEAGWDVVIVDEAHKLSKQADGTETARYKIGKAMADRAPIFLLLTATPHQGDAGRFLHLLNLVDPYAFVTLKDLTPDRVRQIMVRNKKRAAVDTQGNRLFKQRITTFYPVDRSGPEHDIERQLYERVTEYVAENYDLALRRNDRAFGFLMILYQRMVTSSSQAIRQALGNRLARLRAQWSEMIRYIRSLDPYGNPITIHPTRYGHEQVDDPSVLDLDMLQTGHGDRASIPSHVQTIRQSLSREPKMPVVVGEVCYEGILEASRSEIQRFMFWTTILLGGGGHTYGANGIWQVNTVEVPFGPSPHGSSWGDTPWEEAYRLPGGRHVSVGKSILERYPWWRFEPMNEHVRPRFSEQDYLKPYAAGIDGEVLIVFLPSPAAVNVKGIDASKKYRAMFVDPKNGKEYSIGTIHLDKDSSWQSPTPPIFQDWLLILEAE